MNKKESTFDFDLLKTIIGGILLVAVPLLLLFAYAEYFSGESCDVDCAYGNKMIEQRSDPEPDPIDLNGDGTITRDEAEY